MGYWNKDNFDGLLGLADVLEADPNLAAFADYCRLRERGLRKAAMASVRNASTQAASLDPAKAREAAARLLELAISFRDAHQFLSHPLREIFLLPVIRQWFRDEPEAAHPNRWLGFLLCDSSHFERALIADPEDDYSRGRLIDNALDDVDYAVHHLSESIFIGSIDEARAQLRIAKSHIHDLRNEEYQKFYADGHDRLRQILDDWEAFQNSGASDFVKWSRQMGRSYEFPSVCYYDPD